jgi:hypothetical protein
MSQFFASSSGGGGIKSVQRGVISFGASDLTATATVSSVNTGKAMLSYLGTTTDGGNNSYIARIVLTNATTITATRTSSGVNTDVSWELTEFN